MWRQRRSALRNDSEHGPLAAGLLTRRTRAPKALGRRPQVVLVRHGETEWSKGGRHTSSSDIPLTEAGRSAAMALGARLRRWQFELVLTSPLSRAAETCKLAGLGGDAEERSELVEWDYGEYEGLTTPQIRERIPDWSVWRDGCPGGETADEVGARVDPLRRRRIVRAWSSPTRPSRAMDRAPPQHGSVFSALYRGCQRARLRAGDASRVALERGRAGDLASGVTSSRAEMRTTL